MLALALVVSACAVGAAPVFARPLTPNATLRLAVKITARPPVFSHLRTARFGWKATAATSVGCRIDRHGYRPCASSRTFRNLAAGRHTFYVRVRRRGVVRVAIARWTVDLTRPTVPTVTGGAPAWVKGSVVVRASGSTDVGSGVAFYQYRRARGSNPWSTAQRGNRVTISASGSYRVEFRAVDRARNLSAWSAPTAVLVDNTAPSLPILGGSGAGWQSVPQADVTAGGSVDTNSGLAGYRFSTDGGVTWTSGTDAAVTAEGVTFVEFEAGDVVGNWSAPVQIPIRIDRSLPTVPVVSGGSSSWQNDPAVSVSASGSSDAVSGVAGYQYETSTDGGATWTGPFDGATDPVTSEGTTLVQFRSVDKAGNASDWSVADAGSTVMLDHTTPSVPTVGGALSGWSDAASESVNASGSTDSGGSGLAGYQYETRLDGGAWSTPVSGASALVTDEGTTLVRFRAQDNAGNSSAWSTVDTNSTVMLDRTAPVAALTGGSMTWLSAPSATISFSASDPLSGVSNGSYQYQESTDGGAHWSAPTAGTSATVSTQGQTLVQFSVADNAGNVSTRTATVRLDWTAPTIPTVSGGSTTVWSNAASKTITASATDSGGSGLAGYEYETSLNGGTTWSAAHSGGSVTITAEGKTTVRFRSLDGAGNLSSWSTPGATSTAMLDRTPPTTPKVTGGSTTCTRKQIQIRASSTDALSGIAGYRYRTSTNHGSTWSAPINGSSVRFRSKGTWIVQFQAYDRAGNTTAWAPASAGAANTACHT